MRRVDRMGGRTYDEYIVRGDHTPKVTDSLATHIVLTIPLYTTLLHELMQMK
jgi:hypothetical protein